MEPTAHTVPAEERPAHPSDGGAARVRRIEITVEREVLSVSAQAGGNVAGRCEECNREVALLTPETAALVSQTTPREIYRWLDQRKIHFQELANGHVLICSDSLKEMEKN